PAAHLDLTPFPTRRSSDLPKYPLNRLRSKVGMVFQKPVPFPMSIYDNIAWGIGHHEKLSRAGMDERVEAALRQAALWDEVKDKLDRKSTRLNSSHVKISYA